MVGVALKPVIPGDFRAIGAAESATVNLPVVLLIWRMIVLMLPRIDFAALEQVGRH